MAHTPLKTPTKVAEFLVERLAVAEGELEELRRRLLREAFEPLAQARASMERAHGGLRAGARRLQLSVARLDGIGWLLTRLGAHRLRDGEARRQALEERLLRASPRLLEHHRRRPRHLQQRILATARGRLAAARAQLEGLSRLCVDLSPRRTLDRGFSVTRDAEGRVLRNPAQVSPGDLRTTELLRGVLKSRVEE